MSRRCFECENFPSLVNPNTLNLNWIISGYADTFIMDDVLMIESGFTTQLKTRIEDKIEGHPLWGSQCLLTTPKAVIDTHRDFIKGKKPSNY